MSFPDPNQPPPPAPFMAGPFPGGKHGGGFCPRFPVNYEQLGLSENVPLFKRPRNMEYSSPISAPFPPNNTKVNPPGLGKGTSHIFYKTRMCAKFLEGTCRNGEDCTFAHGVQDLQEPPPNWQELVKNRGQGNWNDDHRMKICKRYYSGEECPYGEKCTFLHERPGMKFKTDMGRQRESSVISIGTVGPILGSKSDSGKPEDKHVNSNSEAFRVKPVYWKTKICSKWEMTGQCPFGERCHFAHGQSELGGAGGQFEAEPWVRSGSIQMKPLSVSVIDPSPAHLGSGASSKEDLEAKKISKWKSTKKINRIYADWIDDLSPPHESKEE